MTDNLQLVPIINEQVLLNVLDVLHAKFASPRSWSSKTFQQTLLVRRPPQVNYARFVLVTLAARGSSLSDAEC